MKPLLHLMPIILIVFNDCQKVNTIDQFKKEILETEYAFAKMAKEEGVGAAFLAFAADSAVLSRETLIIGKENIETHFANLPYTDVILEWEPDFVDVSSSGDLGYTYGKYNFSATDQYGKKINTSGIFHTVWKKQPDGRWKYVWD